jgi:hypothetical protein
VKWPEHREPYRLKSFLFVPLNWVGFYVSAQFRDEMGTESAPPTTTSQSKDAGFAHLDALTLSAGDDLMTGRRAESDIAGLGAGEAHRLIMGCLFVRSQPSSDLAYQIDAEETSAAYHPATRPRRLIFVCGPSAGGHMATTACSAWRIAARRRSVRHLDFLPQAR